MSRDSFLSASSSWLVYLTVGRIEYSTFAGFIIDAAKIGGLMI